MQSIQKNNYPTLMSWIKLATTSSGIGASFDFVIIFFVAFEMALFLSKYRTNLSIRSNQIKYFECLPSNESRYKIFVPCFVALSDTLTHVTNRSLTCITVQCHSNFNLFFLIASKHFDITYSILLH